MISHPELVYSEKLILFRGVKRQMRTVVRRSSAFSFTVKYYITININKHQTI